MPEIQKYSLKEELQQADKQLMNSASLLGMTVLTYPKYINSMRSTMFTSHLKQFLNLDKPEFPYIFTNAENVVGEHSSGYKRAKHDMEIVRKVVKFDDIFEKPNIAKIFLFDKEEQKYYVEERKPVEDLIENFGFNYNNEVIDSLEEGDTIKAGQVYIRSTSYDEDMNYSYGRNIPVAYTLEPWTSEDAAVAAESLRDELASIETEVITIGLNDNDYMLNMYGDNSEFKPLPDIGEMASGFICVIRQQYNNQLLFDFKSSSLSEIHDGDKPIYIDGEQEIIDYTIYSNAEELVDNSFNRQAHMYLRSQNKYYQEILDTCIEIMDSGKEYSREIDYLYKRAMEMLDTSKKWKEGDSAFSNMVIEVTVRKRVPLAKGQKVTGRYGNKSVISDIRPDDEMPFTADGRRAKLLLSVLAIINRTTSMPINEIMANSILWQVRQKMKTFKTYEEKEAFLFDIIYMFNEVEYDKMWKIYRKYSKTEKKDFIDKAIEEGIYINLPSLWESEPIFYRLQKIRNKYTWLKADTMYINKWGRKIKMLNDYWFGEMYIMKLKQSDRRGFSARATGAIDTKGLPTRSFKSRSHLERISSSAIRFGEFETLNFSIGILPEDIALFHAMYRTSIKGRRDLVNLLFSDNENGEAIQKIDDSYTSRVAEIFNVILKSLSIGLDFIDEDNRVTPYNNTDIKTFELKGKIYMCTEFQFLLIERMDRLKEEILAEEPVLTTQELKERIETALRSKQFINGPLFDEDGKLPEIFDEIN